MAPSNAIQWSNYRKISTHNNVAVIRTNMEKEKKPNKQKTKKYTQTKKKKTRLVSFKSQWSLSW